MAAASTRLWFPAYRLWLQASRVTAMKPFLTEGLKWVTNTIKY